MTEKLDHNLKVVRKAIVEHDIDFLLIITGRERIGKSSLGLHTAVTIQPDFSVDQIVFDIQTLYEQVYSLKPGSVVLIDEGATAFFSRDAMSGDVKDGVKLLTVMGERNLFVIICVPSFSILDKYIRKYRVSGVARVVSRGRFGYYSRGDLNNGLLNSKKKGWGDASFWDSFPKFTGKLWNEYTKKKAEYLKCRQSARIKHPDDWVKIGEAMKIMDKSRAWFKKETVEGRLPFERRGSQGVYYFQRKTLNSVK